MGITRLKNFRCQADAVISGAINEGVKNSGDVVVSVNMEEWGRKGAARRSRNRTECARPRAQRCGTVDGHRDHSEPQFDPSLLRPGTAALRKSHRILQTISQPHIVAFTTEKLDPKPGDRILEIGTGSGYQAAVLSRLAATVYSIEIVTPLARQAEATLQRLGCNNVKVQSAECDNSVGQFATTLGREIPRRLPQSSDLLREESRGANRRTSL